MGTTPPEKAPKSNPRDEPNQTANKCQIEDAYILNLKLSGAGASQAELQRLKGKNN